MLKIGKINYLNVYPLYKNLNDFELIEGEPSYLNILLRKGKIDLSPSSSFEYFENQDNYSIIRDLSISSKDKVLSVVFVTTKPIEKMDNDEICLSPASSTSNSLIKIILYEFFNKKGVTFKSSKKNMFTLDKNQVLIGDPALAIYLKPPKNHFVYDMARLWYNYTKLPFVFALWLVNKNIIDEKKDYLKVFIDTIKKNKDQCSLPEIYKNFTKEEIKKYFSYIDYDLNKKHVKSLELYAKLCYKYKLINHKIKFNFL